MIETADQRWKDFYSRLEHVDPDNTGHQVFKEAMRPQNYAYQIGLINQFKTINGMRILEVGCGFGGLCRQVYNNHKPTVYICVDNVEMLKFAKKTLVDLPITFYDASVFEFWKPAKFHWEMIDLFISNYCISETPREYQNRVLEEIVPVAKNIFMLDGDKKSDYEQRLTKALKDNFNKVSREKYDPDWRVDVFTATENKNA